MSHDPWADLADVFVDQAYASAKGGVRTAVVHRQLQAHLPPPPAPVLDVGGGAGHQSLPLARLGYTVTLLDPSPAMLERAQARLDAEPDAVRGRVTLVEARGEDVRAATGGNRFAAVLCHGVLMYVEEPAPLVGELCAAAAPGGVVSVLALNARAMAVRPALEHRWADALAAFDARTERGVLGVDTRADTVEDLFDLLGTHQVDPEAWYGVWLFSDWIELAAAGSGEGPEVEPDEVPALAEVELEAGRRDPYRQLSRLLHLIGRRRP